MLTNIFGRHPDVCTFNREGHFFEEVESVRENSETTYPEYIAQEMARSKGLDAEEKEDLLSHLEEVRYECDGIIDLYKKAKKFVAHEEGANAWVQKATSYVFYIEKIIKNIPSSRLIFLVRNPLDTAGSISKRNNFRSHILRNIWGWNKGVKKALNKKRTFGNKIAICKYEDLAKKPEKEAKRIFSFCGLKFEKSYIRVNHVHSADTEKYDREKGVNTSKIDKYTNEISTREESLVRTLVNEELFEDLYPEISDKKRKIKISSKIMGYTEILLSIFGAQIEILKEMGAGERSNRERIKKRASILFERILG